MREGRAGRGRLVAGLAAALVVALGFGHWLQSSGLRGQHRLGAERSAVIALRAVTELVEGLGLDGEELQSAVGRFARLDPSVEAIRVLRFKGIRLTASTAPGDVGDNAAPRKMAREEKPLYDLGQALRAAVETNRSEGRAWKEELDVRRRDDGGLSLAGPVGEEGEIAGAVILEAAAASAAPAPGWPMTLVLLVLPLVLLALVAPKLDARRGVAVAAVLLLAALIVQGATGLGRFGAERRAVEEGIARRLAETAERVQSAAAGSSFAADGLRPESWDADRFRRPRGLAAVEGPIDRAVAGELAAARTAYWKRLAVPALIALALLAWIGLGGASRTGSTLVRHRRAYLYAAPALVGMIVLVFIPFLYSVVLSFTNANIYNTDKLPHEIWVGLQNFADIITDFSLVETTAEGRLLDYQNFYWTLGFTIIWTVTNVSVGVSLGLLLALILNTRGFVLKPIYRVLLILPWAMPNYITALIWRGMFHSQFGVINQVIQMLGGEAVSWFDTPFTAFITVLSTNGWLSFPFMMVISLGALQSIPADLYEAARVDGAGRWQQFRTITLPSLKPALVPAVILSVVWTFNQFNVIYLVSGGEPGGSTEILITEAYKLAFEQYRYGYAAAYSLLIFLILLAYGVWQNRVTRATEGI